MPVRLVREGINSSPRINALSRGAELFYRRLMSVVDDYGRYHASPATLRGSCWPTHPENVKEAEVLEWLTECLQVHSICLATDKHVEPLMFSYESGGCKYLQLTGFKQQTRSLSKFPEPAKQLLSSCEENVQPRRRRRRNSETIYEDVDGDVTREDLQNENIPGPPAANVSNPSWMFDETYGQFADLASKFWPRVLPNEISDGHRWYWGKLSIEERIMATRNLRQRVDAGEDGEYVKHMPDYLKSEWRRGPKPSSQNGHSKPPETYTPPPGLVTGDVMRQLQRERDERAKS